MKLKRIFLRYSLSFQKYKIKLKNLELKDLYKFSLIVSKRLADIVHLRNLVLFCLTFSILVSLMFLSSFSDLKGYYYKDKAKSGGTYSEGTLGKFYRLNPIYSVTNTTDEDAVNLIFSGLMKRSENRGLKEDLASKWSLSEDKKSYTFELKKGIKWHDGADFSADDVVFTVGLIQNPDARSPLYETWKGVIVEKTPSGGVKFTLNAPADSFLENTTLKILPQHLLKDIPAASIQTVDFNIKPVGTGPYKFESLEKSALSQTLNLKANDKFYDKTPYIERIRFVSLGSEKEVLDAYRRRTINAIGNPTEAITEKVENDQADKVYEYQLPRYVGAFFNVDNLFLKDKNLRLAISLLPDRSEMVKEAVGGKGLVVYTPITPGLAGYNGKVAVNKQDINKAKEILKAGNYVLEGGTLKYGGKEVKLRVVTDDTTSLKKTADILAEELKALGVKTEVISVNMNTLQKEYVRPRNYDVLVIGENLNAYPDLFGFWHSSQINDPGINFSKYKDRKLDKFLEITRALSDMKEKQPRLDEIQKTIIDEAPAMFLYNPFYYFIASSQIKGVDAGKIVYPSDRLSDVASWYIKADRVIIDK